MGTVRNIAGYLNENFKKGRYQFQTHTDVSNELKQAQTLFDLNSIKSRMLGYKGVHSSWHELSCWAEIPQIDIPTIALNLEEKIRVAHSLIHAFLALP